MLNIFRGTSLLAKNICDWFSSFFNFRKSENLYSLGFGSSLRESKNRDVEKGRSGTTQYEQNWRLSGLQGRSESFGE